jgi:uncharacterized cofD-like protein
VRSRRWLTLGIGVKRYLLVIFVGTVVLALALAMLLAFVYRTFDVPGPAGTVVYYLTLQWIDHPFRELIVGVFGLLVVLAGALLLARSVLSVVVRPDDNLAEILYQNRRLQRGPRIVAIGGGTGLGVLLRGLKEHTNHITAVVTMADDGGSSGRLREEFGLMPPGDVRQCLAALADSESLMNEVMEYRFSRGEGLQGHSLGNLLIAATTDIHGGNFERGVNALSQVLRVRGRILPSSLSEVRLAAELDDGSIIRGESRIRSAGRPLERVFIEPRHVSANGRAVKEILAADMIVLGPGSVFTSVLPNLLVGDIATAVRASGAVKVYVCNVATQRGETEGYTVAAHHEALKRHTSVDLVDFVVANEHPVELGPKFFGTPVVHDGKALTHARLVLTELTSAEHPVRHDSDRLALAIMDVYDNGSRLQSLMKSSLSN